MWHGIEKSKSLQARFLLNATMKFDMDKRLIELNEIRNSNEYFTLLLHSRNLLYISNNGTKGVLQYHCPKCIDEFAVNGGSRKTNVFINNSLSILPLFNNHIYFRAIL